MRGANLKSILAVAVVGVFVLVQVVVLVALRQQKKAEKIRRMRGLSRARKLTIRDLYKPDDGNTLLRRSRMCRLLWI